MSETVDRAKVEFLAVRCEQFAAHYDPKQTVGHGLVESCGQALRALLAENESLRHWQTEAEETNNGLVQRIERTYAENEAQTAELRAMRKELALVADVLRGPLSDACEYEGGREASVYLSVDALRALRLVLAAREGA